MTPAGSTQGASRVGALAVVVSAGASPFLAQTLTAVSSPTEKKKSPEVITNWKEIERVSDKPPYEIGAAVYQKIYVFALLMQTCMSGAAQ